MKSGTFNRITNAGMITTALSALIATRLLPIIALERFGPPV